MGSGVSSEDVTSTLQGASEDSIQAAVASLSPEDFAKLEQALGMAISIQDVSSWYMVEHVMKNDADHKDTKAFWEGMTAMMGDPEQKAMKAMYKGNAMNGYYNHFFCPISTTRMYCLWQVRNTGGSNKAGLQKLLDTGVCPVAKNTCHKIDPALNGGQFGFKSAFTGETDLSLIPPMYKSDAAFWVVEHKMKSTDAAGKWWGEMSKMMETPEDMKKMTDDNADRGIFNHAFYPITQNLIFCMWEGQDKAKDKEIEDVLGDNGKIGRGAFVNTLHYLDPALTGGFCAYQSAPSLAPAEIFCQPCGTDAPTKQLGPAGNSAKMFLNKCTDGRTVSRIVLESGFDWRANVKPLLPGNPDWCPATHFGYLESGEMGVEMKDGTKFNVKAGEAYLIPPGHLPRITQTAVMVEYAQDQIYTTDKFIKTEEKDASGAPRNSVAQVATCEINAVPSSTDAPTKAMGQEGNGGAKMYIGKFTDGRTVTRIKIDKGFDWKAIVKPIMPGCPDWCPATHFGYLESGKMNVQMRNGSKHVVEAGQSYFVPPGHLPSFEADTVMVEFAQEQVYTRKSFIERQAQ